MYTNSTYVERITGIEWPLWATIVVITLLAVSVVLCCALVALLVCRLHRRRRQSSPPPKPPPTAVVAQTTPSTPAVFAVEAASDRRPMVHVRQMVHHQVPIRVNPNECAHSLPRQSVLISAALKRITVNSKASTNTTTRI